MESGGSLILTNVRRQREGEKLQNPNEISEFGFESMLLEPHPCGVTLLFLYKSP
jgi:hypothetical protein